MSSTVRVPLSVLDHIWPSNYPASSWYIPLKDGVTPQEAFSALKDGLRLTFKQLPWLSGKLYHQAPSTPGWRPGQIEIRYEPEDLEGDSAPLPQFRFKIINESESLMTYDEIRECGFPMDAFSDDDLLWGEHIYVPDEESGAYCVKIQANFIQGAVILCGGINHKVCDGTAEFDIWRVWAANCDALQSGCTPILPDPMSSDRSLIERIWATESTYSQPEHMMQPNSWTLLSMDPPGVPRPTPGGTYTIPSTKHMQAFMFYLSPEKFAALHKHCVEKGGAASSISAVDALTALIWRSLLRARRTAARDSGRASEADLNEAEAKLQIMHDGRPGLSRRNAVPSPYLGNLAFMNDCVLPLAQLTGSEMSVADIALAIREVANAATPDAMLDACTIARRLHDLSDLEVKISPLRGYDLILSPIIMVDVDDVRWGGNVFASGGKPDGLRPHMDAFNKGARLCFSMPRQKGSGASFIANMYPDELEALLEDEEFGEYAMYLSS
jgi:trichothecene 3-O-acetyltransferase